jgi:membrane protein DedA with SNARE-associated domain
VNVDALLISVSPVVVYVLVGLVIALESMGIPLPGEVILVSAALLAARQELDVSPVWVAVAASAGVPRHASPDRLAYTEHVFARYGVWAVFFGRFVALLRIFAGPMAGALRMPYPRFLAANALGGLVWACGTTTAVYTLGTRAEGWLKESSWIGLALAVAVGIAVSTIFRRRLERAVARHAAEHDSLPGVEPGPAISPSGEPAISPSGEPASPPSAKSPSGEPAMSSPTWGLTGDAARRPRR